ncbi:MAG: YigZ family protein [Clostridia bacterium]|nr:YigZ family protein [Clostridia bacterium]
MIEIKKSKFIGVVYKVDNVADVKKILEELKKEHKKSTHICYAYKIVGENYAEKAFDDGEPSGTAGKPILNVINKKGLSNILVVIVRYFGGIKLGAGGLVRAYTKAASEITLTLKKD